MKKILIASLASLAVLAGCGPATSKPDITTALNPTASSVSSLFIPQATVDNLTGQGYSITDTYKGNINVDGKIMITNLALLSKGGSDNQYILTQYASGTTTATTYSGKWTQRADTNGSGNSNLVFVTLYKDETATNWFKKGGTFLIPLDKDGNQLKGGNLTLAK